MPSSLQEITAQHVGNVLRDSNAQKRSLHFQTDVEARVSHRQATQCYPAWLWP